MLLHPFCISNKALHVNHLSYSTKSSLHKCLLKATLTLTNTLRQRRPWGVWPFQPSALALHVGVVVGVGMLIHLNWSLKRYRAIKAASTNRHKRRLAAAAEPKSTRKIASSNIGTSP